MIPPKPPSILEWLTERSRSSSFCRTKLAQMEQWPYLRGIYECTSLNRIVCGATGMGMTEYALTLSMFICDVLSKDCIHLFPKVSESSEFFIKRLIPAVRRHDVDALYSGSNDTLRLGKGDLWIGGGSSNSHFCSKSRGYNPFLMIVDGADRMKPQFVKFLEQWAKDKGVPTVFMGGMSQGYTRGMYRLWRASDRRQWHVKCERCGSWERFCLDNLVARWNGDRTVGSWYHDSGTPFFICEGCGKPLNRHQKGEWIAEKPDRDTAGFLLSSAIDPACSIYNIVAPLVSTEEGIRRNCLNNMWGLPYASPTAFDRFILGRKDRQLWPYTKRRPRRRTHARQAGRKVSRPIKINKSVEPMIAPMNGKVNGKNIIGFLGYVGQQGDSHDEWC